MDSYYFYLYEFTITEPNILSGVLFCLLDEKIYYTYFKNNVGIVVEEIEFTDINFEKD